MLFTKRGKKRNPPESVKSTAHSDIIRSPYENPVHWKHTQKMLIGLRIGGVFSGGVCFPRKSKCALVCREQTRPRHRKCMVRASVIGFSQIQSHAQADVHAICPSDIHRGRGTSEHQYEGLVYSDIAPTDSSLSNPHIYREVKCVCWRSTGLQQLVSHSRGHNRAQTHPVVTCERFLFCESVCLNSWHSCVILP